MTRPLRIGYEGAFYHVTARGKEGRKIFFSKPDYGRFKGYLREAQDKYGYLLHSFVLMTNHYHLLIETARANLSQVMHAGILIYPVSSSLRETTNIASWPFTC